MTDRKARLAALAAKAGRAKQPQSDDAPVEEESAVASRSVNFRNYTPADPQLEQAETDDEPSAKRAKQNEKSVLEKALEEAKAETPQTRAEEDLVAIAPKKINWDLKRDIKPKLDKLERRTQKAIVELLRERLEQEANAADID